MGITGVGAKKLESYGAAFLAVITGRRPGSAAPRPPQTGRARRRRQVFDRLDEAQLDLSRGDGRHRQVT